MKHTMKVVLATLIASSALSLSACDDVDAERAGTSNPDGSSETKTADEAQKEADELVKDVYGE